MFIYQLQTKRGCRFYETYEGANRTIEEDIADVYGTILSDTRNGEEGKVVIEYNGFFSLAKEVYEIKRVPLYK